MCKFVCGLWANITKVILLCNVGSGRSRQHCIAYFPVKKVVIVGLKCFYVSICMPLGQHCRSNILYNVVLNVFKQHQLDICNVVPAWSIQHCISYFPH